MGSLRLAAIVIAALCSSGIAAPSYARYDPAKEYAETPAVAARYPDPGIDIPTPAFKVGKSDFTSQEELLAFVYELARRSPDLRVRITGKSQENRASPLLVFARPAVGSGTDLLKSGKPTVLIIGQ